MVLGHKRTERNRKRGTGLRVRDLKTIEAGFEELLWPKEGKTYA
jgi:hypothetical protein